MDLVLTLDKSKGQSRISITSCGGFRSYPIYFFLAFTKHSYTLLLVIDHIELRDFVDSPCERADADEIPEASQGEKSERRDL